MSAICSRVGARECTDAELVARLPTLVQAERHAMADAKAAAARNAAF